ncbi:MAG: IS1 family transposase [Betaproteobacteria bacterium]|nr:IS1 family transposase [Betaproteobacteria bacterium]
MQQGDVAERPERCPHCQATANGLHPRGSAHGLPRYRCRCRGRTCNPLAGTASTHPRKREQRQRYSQALIDRIGIRAAARRCGIDKNTAFRWRHRFLGCPASHRAGHEGGVVGADETFFPPSCKGLRGLPRPARKRGGVGKARETGSDQIAVLAVRNRGGLSPKLCLKEAAAHQSLQQLIQT